MTQILMIGCGVIGATIAYELSSIAGVQVTVIDRTSGVQGCTSAALGVMMGCISQKTKGRAWQMRETSIRRYDTLIPELETLCQQTIPYNRQGILMLCRDEQKWQQKQKLAKTRQSQGWELQLWSRATLQERCPHLAVEQCLGAVYSPQDRQVHPKILTECLIKVAQMRGVRFEFGEDVVNLVAGYSGYRVQTQSQEWQADRVIIAAGLGSPFLAQYLQTPLDIRPVLGQAIAYEGEILGDPDFQPAITSGDVHVVPSGVGGYWVGATVEFPDEQGEVMADEQLLNEVKEAAIAFCPGLQHLNMTEQWSGLRPRPHNQPAPVISQLPGHEQVWLATGHYRNGVLLAPATAQILIPWLQS
ncbi:MAG: FAD-binding oxidoreductase [Roseofilum sp. SBFL]|uniref:NAD(P)/FAD-dependent oxidoreductase n=3 Tax=Roseofilum TaxID=1233426 RepID=UPI001B1689E0|nr:MULTISPECIES: FAD-dependent oxidoreductase [unclassified Roseofilum]MBP0015620.1 FAD-binding oxidoreductase [Roseofilum sp. SID3]MBP0024090.1 FAD-binding oxidoreductase [Roseofilum sp. SID2]MBP0040184.1 FAD-binding oxidoreductase [Roseofilum sp. SID1]MBP0043582.1 FAD-binding oxidoreductase [Roseofilum sp. SBFL]